MSFLSLYFFQKTNENTSHTSRNEFILSFLGRIHGLTICFRNSLTFPQKIIIFLNKLLSFQTLIDGPHTYLASMKQRWWSKSNPTARACVGDLVAIPVTLLSYERHRLQQIFPPQRQRLSPKLQKKAYNNRDTVKVRIVLSSFAALLSPKKSN